MRRSDRRRATVLALAGTCATGFARERETDHRDDAVGPIPVLGFSMRGMIFFVAGLAMIFLASAVQTFGTNWLGQVCPYPGPCFRPEWLAFGIALAAAAYIAWRSDRPRR
jgi:hypothetical protein